MHIELSQAPITSVADLEHVPIAFNVDRICDVMPVGIGSERFALLERTIDVPYVKDYDRIDGEGPTQWASRFDITNWGFIRAHSKGRLVGGAVIAFNTPGVTMLEGRKDLAVLWDIRVSAEVREQGAGSALLRAAETWAISKGCTQLKVETQNINVAACRFYEQHGFVLRAVDRFAYPELPGEIQLLWWKDLAARPADADLKPSIVKWLAARFSNDVPEAKACPTTAGAGGLKWRRIAACRNGFRAGRARARGRCAASVVAFADRCGAARLARSS